MQNSIFEINIQFCTDPIAQIVVEILGLEKLKPKKKDWNE
jgi:hypothetical protein